MASSSSFVAGLSRSLSRLLLYPAPNPRWNPFLPSIRLCSRNTTTFFSSSVSGSDVDPDPNPDLEADFDIEEFPPDGSNSTAESSEEQPQQRINFERPLENGLDQGVYKAILVGKVGQKPVQKRLKGGRVVTLFSVGTGGIRNNRRPLDNEEPREYANRCAVQWHRISVYPERLGSLAMKHVKPGSIIYLEGNLETKIFSDPISGLVRRIREIALRRDGRLVFLGKGSDEQESDLRGVGYF